MRKLSLKYLVWSAMTRTIVFVPIILGILYFSNAHAQTKVVVIPMFDEKITFTGILATGNSKCTDLNTSTNHWFYASPSCTILGPELRGQDGEYMRGATATPRFTINNDGTVRDNLTTLIWLQDAFCAPAADTWAKALKAISDLNVSGTMDNTNSCGDSGNRSDWRLPQVHELQSLMSYGDHGSPYVSNTQGSGQWSENDPFASLQVDNAYWSSTTYGVGTNPIINDDFLDNALSVNFGSGETKGEGKAALKHIWAVRGGASVSP